MPQSDYVPLERLCAGYFGKELKLQEKGVGGKVRLAKVVRFPNVTKAKLAAESLRQEIQLRQLKHKNVLKFKDTFEMVESGGIYLCTVWSHYEDSQIELLNDFIVNRKESLDIDEAKALMVQLAEGVSYLHVNGLSHNALTPFSVLVLKNSSGEAVVKIKDYGLTQVCGRPYDENYRPDGGRIRSMLYHLPPEAFGRSWDRCCKNFTNTAADVFMLGLIFIAIAEQTMLPPQEKNEANKRNIPNTTDDPIIAPFLQYPGYAPIPLGKFLHGNTSVDVDQQLYRQSSPALRSLVRRMLQMIPGKRPPASGVSQILSTIKYVRRTDKMGSQSSLADSSTSSVRLGKRRRSASLRYDPTESPCKRRTMIKRLPSILEKKDEAKEAGSAFVRRASIRMKTTRNFLMRKGSMKISD